MARNLQISVLGALNETTGGANLSSLFNDVRGRNPDTNLSSVVKTIHKCLNKGYIKQQRGRYTLIDATQSRKKRETKGNNKPKRKNNKSAQKPPAKRKDKVKATKPKEEEEAVVEVRDEDFADTEEGTNTMEVQPPKPSIKRQFCTSTNPSAPPISNPDRNPFLSPDNPDPEANSSELTLHRTTSNFNMRSHDHCEFC